LLDRIDSLDEQVRSGDPQRTARELHLRGETSTELRGGLDDLDELELDPVTGPIPTEPDLSDALEPDEPSLAAGLGLPPEQLYDADGLVGPNEITELGRPTEITGDPEQTLEAPGLALGQADEVPLGMRPTEIREQVPLGQRPTEIRGTTLDFSTEPTEQAASPLVEIAGHWDDEDEPTEQMNVDRASVFPEATDPSGLELELPDPVSRAVVVDEWEDDSDDPSTAWDEMVVDVTDFELPPEVLALAMVDEITEVTEIPDLNAATWTNSLGVAPAVVRNALRLEHYPDAPDASDEALVTLARLDERLLELGEVVGRALFALSREPGHELWEAALLWAGVRPLVPRQAHEPEALRLLCWAVAPELAGLLDAARGAPDTLGLGELIPPLREAMATRAALCQSDDALAPVAGALPVRAIGLHSVEGFSWS
jgi:hypothetical protein